MYLEHYLAVRDGNRSRAEERRKKNCEKNGTAYEPKFFKHTDGHWYTEWEIDYLTKEAEGAEGQLEADLGETDVAEDIGGEAAELAVQSEDDCDEPEEETAQSAKPLEKSAVEPLVMETEAVSVQQVPAVVTAEEIDRLAASELYSLESLTKLQKEAKEGGYGCLDCHFTGWVITYGEKAKCSCQMAASLNAAAKIKQTKAPTIEVEAALASGDRAVCSGIIPAHRKDDEFDADIAKESVLKSARDAKAIQARDVQEYVSCLQGILASISTNTLRCSYVIGAPKCCGKTTFVMTALKRLVNADKKVVPYLSLTEIAEIQVKHAMSLNRQRKGNPDGQPGERREQCSWKDIRTADVLFTYLTNYEAAGVELSVLKELLQERGLKGLPTIVMTENPVAMYEQNPDLKRVFWNDIENYDPRRPTVKKLTHVSTWRQFPKRV